MSTSLFVYQPYTKANPQLAPAIILNNTQILDPMLDQSASLAEAVQDLLTGQNPVYNQTFGQYFLAVVRYYPWDQIQAINRAQDFEDLYDQYLGQTSLDPKDIQAAESLILALSPLLALNYHQQFAGLLADDFFDCVQFVHDLRLVKNRVGSLLNYQFVRSN